MNASRREFLGLGSAVLGGAALAPHGLFAEDEEPAPDAGAAVPEGGGDLKVRFLGTGVGKPEGPRAANKFGEVRRWTSVLLDGKVLIDLNEVNIEMLPEGCRPEAVFYTHSHPDHYNPQAALALGVKRVYCHKSWADVAEGHFRKHAKGRPVPEVTGLEFGKPVVEGGLEFTSLPANHSTSKPNELCSIYLVEKGVTRLLYAVDTCGLPREALKFSVNGSNPDKPLTAIIMEATAGIGLQDYAGLFFSHSSVDTVARTTRALLKTGRYRPPAGRNVYITHLWRDQYPAQAEADAKLPAPLKAAYDGLEVVF